LVIVDDGDGAAPELSVIHETQTNNRRIR
jgi:hypothetical protein